MVHAKKLNGTLLALFENLMKYSLLAVLNANPDFPGKSHVGV